MKNFKTKNILSKYTGLWSGAIAECHLWENGVKTFYKFLL